MATKKRKGAANPNITSVGKVRVGSDKERAKDLTRGFAKEYARQEGAADSLGYIHPKNKTKAKQVAANKRATQAYNLVHGPRKKAIMPRKKGK